MAFASWVGDNWVKQHHLPEKVEVRTWQRSSVGKQLWNSIYLGSSCPYRLPPKLPCVNSAPTIHPFCYATVPWKMSQALCRGMWFISKGSNCWFSSLGGWSLLIRTDVSTGVLVLCLVLGKDRLYIRGKNLSSWEKPLIRAAVPCNVLTELQEYS